MSQAEDLLAGTRVLELGSGVALSHAGQLLADAGAEVIKVEPAGGDPLRGELPIDATGSAVFEYLNRGKKSVCIEWPDARGAAVLQRLRREADAVIHFLTGEDAAAYERLAGEAGSDGVVECAISAYGEQGPLSGKSGAEVVIQGMANYFSSLGRLGKPPVRIGADIAGMNTGLFAALAVVTGLLDREATGRAPRASCSMLGSLVHLRSVMWGALSDPDAWWGFHLDSETKPPDEAWKTKDGRIWFNLHRGSSEDWDRLLIELDMLDAADDPRFQNFGRDSAGTGRHTHTMKPRWEAAFAKQGTRELLSLLHEMGANAVPMNDYEQVFAHPHPVARGLGAARLQSGRPAILSPWMVEAEISEQALQARLAVPRLGEHTETVLRDVGYSARELQELRSAALIA